MLESALNIRAGKKEIFLVIRFLTNTMDRSVAPAKSGRIIQVGNSGIIGVDDGVEVDRRVGLVTASIR